MPPAFAAVAHEMRALDIAHLMQPADGKGHAVVEGWSLWVRDEGIPDHGAPAELADPSVAVENGAAVDILHERVTRSRPSPFARVPAAA